MAETVYDVSRAKFEGFGTHKLPIEVHVNELIEMTKTTKKEFPWNG